MRPRTRSLPNTKRTVFAESVDALGSNLASPHYLCARINLRLHSLADYVSFGGHRPIGLGGYLLRVVEERLLW
eukprot:3735998-Rhodomonas_salina.1